VTQPRICADLQGDDVVNILSARGTCLNDASVAHALLAHADDFRIGRFRLCFLAMVPGPRAAPVEGGP